MHNRMTSNRGVRLRITRGARALAAMIVAVTFFSFAGAGPAAAQGTYYAGLNAAVTDLTSRLVENEQLAGKRVLVNAHDFFEEGTGRNLPLSATLRERFSTELSTRRGMAVFALPEGSEDDMVILQGVWRDVSEPGAESGTRTVHLTVKLVERTTEGHRVLSSKNGRVERIDARLLVPDLASWGRHVVRKLEDQARQRRRQIVRVGEVVMDGVPEPDRARRYLVRRWLIPAFAQSRLFGLATGIGEQSEATLQVDVFMDSEQVEVVLDIRDGAGGPIGAATVDIAKGVFPARYFPSTETKTPVTDSGSAASPLAGVEERRIAELTPEMVRIAGGCFEMGSPESETGRDDDERQHEVCVESFSLGKHEVTRGRYAVFVRETGRAEGDACWTFEDGGWEERSGRSWRLPGYGQGDMHPVVCVSHEEAQAYARWLSGVTGRRYRLATESEWEYAVRAGTRTSRYWGDDASGACEYANVADRALKERYPDWKGTIHTCRDRHVHTAPVGSFGANGWGFHDMLGNVWEWTCSEYEEDYGGAESRCASGSAGRRVIRGGSWLNDPAGVRSAYRTGTGAGDRYSDLGFRLAQD